MGLASEWFESVFGEAPPERDWWRDNRIAIDAVLNDGTKPLYTVDVDEDGRRFVTLHLHEGQMRAWRSERRFVFMIAGTQGGKTSFLPWLLARDILREDMDTGAGGDSLVVTATYDLFNLKLLPAMREVFEEVLGIARYHAGDRVFELRNAKTGAFDAVRAADGHKMFGRIFLRSASTSKSGKKSQTSDGGGLESATAKRAMLDECGQDGFSFNAWKAIRRRLSLAMGRVYAGTTPYNLGWLKLKIFDPWEKKERDDVDVVQFSSVMNPAFSMEEFESAKLEMQDHEFNMMYKGEFGRPAGVIYEAFDDRLRRLGGHLVKPFKLPKEWARYQAVDPGVVNWAKIWAAHDPVEDVYYIYREEFGGERRTAGEHAKDDLALERQNGERVVRRGIGAKSEIYIREDYTKAGADGVKEPDTNSVEEGIDRGVSLFKQHRVYLFDDCVGLVDDLNRYARVVNEMGEVTPDILDKSKFHLADAYRYLAVLLVKGKAKKRKSRRKSYVE